MPFLCISKRVNSVYINPLEGSLANSEDPDKMQRNAAFYQGLHCLLRLNQPSETEVQS